MKKITLTKTLQSHVMRLMFCFFLLVGLNDVVQAQVSYTQDFSTTSHGWTLGTGFARTTTSFCATTASVRKNIYTSAGGMITSPTVGASNGGLITMTYYYKLINYSGGTATPNTFGSIKVQFSTNNSTWVDVPGSTVSSDHVPSTDCVQKTVTFTPSPSTALYVRLSATYGTGDYYLYFDDVAISQGAAPSCFAPTAVTASAITDTSATIAWTAPASAPAEGYEYYVATSTTAPTSTTVATGSTAAGVVTTNLTSLTSNTSYNVWVRSKCGATDLSDWSIAGTFRTLCVAFTTPFTETFDSTSSSEFCWTVLNVAGTADAWNTNYTTNPFAGNQCASIDTDYNAGANNDWLITPKITLTANQRIRFQSRVESAAEPNDFEVLLSTTGNAAADFTNTLIANTSYSNVTYNQLQASLAAYTGDVYIAFHVPANGLDGWKIYIDDVVVEDIPTTAPACVVITSPVDLAENVSNPLITWNAQLDATSYKLSIGTTAGGTDILSQFSVGNVTSYNLTQAEAGTTYYVTVYPVNQYGTATGCTEISFTTCDENTTLNENFDAAASGSTAALPTCWSRLGTTGSSYVTTGSVAPASPANRWYLYASATTVAYAHTPILSNLAANTHRLRFKAYGTTASKLLSVGYLTTPGDVSTFTLLQDVNLGTGITGASIGEYVVTPGALAAGVKNLVFKNNSQNASIYIDDVIWEEIPAVAPSCAANVVATPDTACGNYATAVTWDVVTNIDGYKISIGTTTGGTDILNEQVITTNSYSHIGNPGATYFFKVVPFNNVGSAASCTEISYSTNATGCFCTSAPTSNDGAGITNVKIVNTDFPTTDVFYFDHTANAVDVQQGVNTNVQVSFATGYTYGTHVWIDLNNNFTFETSELLYSGESLATNPTTLNASFMMPATAALGQHRMRIATADSGQATPNPCYSGSYGVTLDFTVNVTAAPSCLPPSALATTSVSPTAQNLAWTENGSSTSWDIEWGTNGFTPTGTPTVAATTTNPYSLTGLTSNTTYQFYVRSVCSTTESSAWTGPFAFTTACASYSALSENFDALTVSGSIPNCWSRVLSGSSLSSFATVGTTTTNNSAPNSIAFYNSSSTATDNMMLVSPVMTNLSAGTHRLRFFARNGSATQDLQIGTMTNPADASTFTVLQTVDLTTSWSEYSVSFAAYTGADTHFAFRRLSTSTYTYVYLDNVVWEAIPTTPPACVAITSPVDLAENVMSGTITWAASADATSYKITVGTTATGTDILNSVDVGNVTSYNLATEPGTTYYVTISPVNQYGTTSGCSAISFTTCDSLIAPLLETFDTFLPSCWSNRFGGDLATGPAATGTSVWFGDGFANNGTTGAIRNNIDYIGSNDWVISPVISIPATGYELKFDAAAVQYGGTVEPTTPWETDDMIQVLISTNGVSWTALYTFNNTNQPSITGTTTTLDLDAYANQDVRFAFRAVEGADDGDADIDFSIDNFEVRLTPATVPSCATVTATPNTNCGNFATAISWAAAAGANGYKISIGTTAGGSEILNASDLGTALTYAHIGNFATTYYVRVVPYNVVGNATGCTEVTYTTNSTGCYCPSAPSSVDGSGITNVQLGTTDFPNTVTTSPVYNAAPATAIDMTQGISNNVQLTFSVASFSGSYDYNTVIWIDANDNYTFEASEIVYTGVSPETAAPTSLNASFVMPTSVPAGVHTMRIVATDEAQDPANPCYSGFYGETADFKINVVVMNNNTFDDASFVYYPNPVTDVLTISYANEISKVQVMNLLGQEVMVKSINATQSQIDMSNLASGSYLVKVTADNKVKTIKVIKR
jgi:pyrimidine deaminase RibD-like protein